MSDNSQLDRRVLEMALEYEATKEATGDMKQAMQAALATIKPPAEAQAQGGGEVVAYIYKERYGHDDSAWIERINRTLPAWEHKDVQPLYAAPPSAPVGVEWLIAEWRAKAALCVDPDPGVQAAGAALECCADELEAALAQQPASDGGFTAADMMVARQEGRKEARQPAAVDGGVIVIDGRRYAVETVRIALLGLAADVARELDAQPGGSDNDRCR